MTTIFKDGSFFEENWQRAETIEDLPQSGFVIVPLKQFLTDPQAILSRKDAVAVLVEAGDDVEQLSEYLDQLEVVAVDFPSFSDGRGFSAARVLREHLAYKGDIRAVGKYILDQVPLARRCGVSSFEISKPEVLKALKAGEWPEVTKYLQPVGTVDELPEGTRPWARRSRREFQEAAE